MKAESALEESKPRRSYRIQGFSGPSAIIRAAKRVARSQRRTFSAYIVTLIDRDLAALTPLPKARGEEETV